MTQVLLRDAGIETGVLWRDDNLERLSDTDTFPDESVDLIYLDPPFFSNRVYEVIWGDEAEVRSFEDRWEGGMQHYIGWMRDRVEQMHRVLKSSGSLYLHCDPHASHYLKLMLDEVFGMAQFRNEIIWRRTGSNSAKKRFGPLHQVIFYYVKAPGAPFYPVHGPYTNGYVKDYFIEEDERGRYRPVLLTGPGERKGESGSQWRHYDPTAAGRHWQPATYIYAKYEELTGDVLGQYPLLERLDKLDAAGLIHWGKKSNSVPNFKYYLDDAPGVELQDIWAYQPGTEGCVYGRPKDGIDRDVKWLSTNDRERLGYPTQKPEGVLERIIKASTQKGEIVLDPFCGCGTTIAVAQRLGRQWIGIDISPTALEIVRRRLLKQRCKPDIRNAPNTIESLRALKPFEFQNWIINAINGSHSPRRVHDMGIDGYWFFTKEPVQVKQSEHVGRNVVDNFETAVRRAGYSSGYIIAFSFTRGAHEEVARAKKEGMDIRLLTVKEVLLLVRRPSAKFGPQPASIEELPLPEVRKPKDMPSARELVASDRTPVSLVPA